MRVGRISRRVRTVCVTTTFQTCRAACRTIRATSDLRERERDSRGGRERERVSKWELKGRESVCVNGRGIKREGESVWERGGGGG